MMKKIAIIGGVIILILILIFFPKTIGSSGGLSGGGSLSIPQCKCFGFHFTRYANYPDGIQTEYCSGIPYNCKCFGVVEGKISEVTCK